MALQAEQTVSGRFGTFKRLMPLLAEVGRWCYTTFLTQDQYLCNERDLGFKAVAELVNTGKLPNLESTTKSNLEILELIKECINLDPWTFDSITHGIYGVSEETTTGVKEKGSGILVFPAINVDDSVTKSKYDSSYGCRPSFPGGLLGAKHFMFADNVGAIGAKDFMFADLVGAIGAKDFMFADTVGAIGAKDFMFAHKVGAIGAKGFMFVHKVGVGCGYGDGGKPFCAGITGFAKGRLMNLGCATDHPVLSCLAQLDCATDHPVLSCLAQLELWNEKKSGKYEDREV